MSDQSYYSESFLSEVSVAPGNQLIEKLKTELRNELESYKREMTGKVQFLQVKLSDAEIDIAGLKKKNEELEKRIDELENKAETQELKIDQLEKTLDEKIIETEMKKVTTEQKEMTASEMVATKNFGLNNDELETLCRYGCLGHFLENDKCDEKKWIDENCFALLLKAIDHGMKNFSFKLYQSTELQVGTSRLVFSAESEKHKDGMWINGYRFSLTHEGRKLRFLARCQLMDLHEGYERICFDFKETNSNGLYKQIFISPEIPGRRRIFCRFHVTLIN